MIVYSILNIYKKCFIIIHTIKKWIVTPIWALKIMYWGKRGENIAAAIKDYYNNQKDCGIR